MNDYICSHTLLFNLRLAGGEGIHRDLTKKRTKPGGGISRKDAAENYRAKVSLLVHASLVQCNHLSCTPPVTESYR